MFRNNFNIPNDEIALLKKRVRLTAEKLNQENDARLLTFANNAKLSSSSSNSKPNVLQDISKNQTIRANKINRSNRYNRSNSFNTFGTDEYRLNYLARKFFKK